MSTPKIEEFLAHCESLGDDELLDEHILQVEQAYDDYVAHYASKYYDPQKAREYYLRTRKLKGRRSTKGWNEGQRQSWAMAKDQIGAQRKQDNSANSRERTAKVKALRAQAKAMRQRISDELKAAIARIDAPIVIVGKGPLKRLGGVSSAPKALDKVKSAREKAQNAIDAAKKAKADKDKAIEAKRAKDLEAAKPKLEEIPENASRARREQIKERNEKATLAYQGKSESINKEADKAKDQAKKDLDNSVSKAKQSLDKAKVDAAKARAAKTAARKKAAAAKKSATANRTAKKKATRETAKAKKQKLAADLRGALDKAKADFESKKAGLKKTHDKAEETAYKEIASHTPPPKKKSKRKK